MAGTRVEVERFDGKGDFALWRQRMRAVLVQMKVSKALQGEDKLPETMSAAEKADVMEMAYSTLILHLGDKVLREVSKETTAAGVWLKLEQLYMTKTLTNRIYLKGKLFGFKMTEGKSLDDNIDEFSKIVIDLENIGVKIEDEDQAIMILNSLSSSYSTFVETIKYSRETLSLEEVLAALKSKQIEQLSLKAVAESLSMRGRSEQGSQSKSGSKSKKGGKKNFGKSQSPTRGKENKQFKCFHCHKEGHYRRNCPERKKSEQGEAAVVEDGYESAEVLCVSSQLSDTVWIMDSGCSFHMTPNKQWFESLSEGHLGTVLLGNDKSCKMMGSGSVRLKMFNGQEKILTDVRYVPQLKRNLISLGALDKLGYSFKSQNGSITVAKGSMVVMKGYRKNGLYYLLGSTVVGGSLVNVADVNSDKTSLWHLRLGHVSDLGIQKLKERGCFGKDKVDKLDFCEVCILGKSCKVKFDKAVHRTSDVLEYIHSDVWGPTRTESIGGKRYFVTFIDDYSRRVWIYFLVHKSEAFSKFKEWKLMVENQTGKKIKRLRTDNGLEFLNKEFTELCKQSGISKHNTVPGNPQQNGLAERFNRTILERVRCMLLQAGLSKSFWAEAAQTACFLINRCPSTALNFKTPMEMWSDHPEDYSRLKVFGCAAYAHVKNDKLEARALKCIFLGYPEGTKGYKLWCLEPGMKKSIVSRDVRFNENEFPLKDGKTEETVHKSKVVLDPCEVSESEVVPAEVEHDGSVDDENVVNELADEGSDGESSRNQLRDYVLVRDRERRQAKPNPRYAQQNLVAFALTAAEEIVNSDPKTYFEAVSSPEKKKWTEAMNDEMDSLVKNKTWELVDKPEGQKLVGCKWVFKKKEGIPGVEAPRYKARLVAKGFTQREGIDYTEIFSPVVKHRTIRIILALVAQENMELEQMDVKTAFLNGFLDEQIFMQQPEGFVKEKHRNKVCLLKKSLYGLKQSPRQWYRRFDEFMASCGFQRSQYDWCLYTKKISESSGRIYLLLYVDDMLIACRCKVEVQKLKDELNSYFEMKDLGGANRILGMNITRRRQSGVLMLDQKHYAQKVITKFRMDTAKGVSIPLAAHFRLSREECPVTEDERSEMRNIPYSSLVGCLMYLMICTRPDLGHSVSLVSRYMSNPGLEHWKALKWIVRYLKSTTDFGLIFRKSEESGSDSILGFVDSDYAGCLDTRRSQTGMVFTLFGTAISWKASLQRIVSLSTTEAEYVAVTEAVKEGIWLRGIMEELGYEQETVKVFSDSSGAVNLSKHQIFHERSKHIDVRLHFVRSVAESGQVKVWKISTDENPADMLTKVVPKVKMDLCLKLVGMGIQEN